MVEPVIGFCTASDGSRVAYATAGSGPALVLVPGWLSHVERIWSHPAAVTALEQLTERHQLVWYDRVGTGLSDRSRSTSDLDDDLDQLRAVLAATSVDRCRLIGYSGGGPVAVRFAAAEPRRVEHLVLYSTYARGCALADDVTFDALLGLVRGGWHLAASAMASIFLPNGSGEDLRWFGRFQRQAATAEQAASFLEFMRSHDVRADLQGLQVPTSVLTNRHDPAVHPDNAREIASLVPSASLIVLEGNEHDPFIRDSGGAVPAILASVEGIPFRPSPPPTPAAPLSQREREVLGLLARGESNKDIAQRLGVRPATVERHVTNLYRKLGARGRADAALHAVSLGLAAPPGR